VYGALVDSLRRGNQITGVKPGFSRFINFLRDFFSRMGNALSGLGYGTTSELLTREAGRGGARFTEELARPAQAAASDGAVEFSARLAPTDEQTIEFSARQTNMSVPEFKTWWEGGWRGPGYTPVQSAARTQSGKPIQYYHGTQKGFVRFGKARSGSTEGQEGPFFFSPEPDFSNQYAEQALYAGAADRYGVKSGQRMLPVFLSVQNPFDTTLPENQQRLLDYVDDGLDNEVFTWKDLLSRDLIELYQGQLDRGVKTEKEVNTTAYIIFKQFLQSRTDNWQSIESKAVQKFLREGGYDGFFLMEDMIKNLAVFDPRQIKSIFNQFAEGAATSPEFSARSVGMTTPEFVDWFGDSKVSDRNGNPVPAYTGSVNQFNAFDLNAASPDSLYGRGFWFSTNPEMAGGVPRNVSSLEEAYTQGEKAQAGYAFQGRKLTINPPSEDKMDAVKELLTDRYVLGKPELQKLKAAASLGANEFAKEFNKVASAAPRYSRQRDQLINFVSDLDLNFDMAGAATVYPAYLSIQNPFDMFETFTHPNFDGKILRYSFMDENGKIINQSVIDNIWKHWISMFSTKPDFDVKKYSEIFWQDMKREFQSPSVVYRSKETISNEDLYNFMVSSADYENQRNGTNIPPKDMVNEALRYRGYDGIKSTSTDIPSERPLPTGERTKTPSDVWVAFDPTQIKSIFNKFEQGFATQPE
jgi:hypothetical protein